MINIPIEIGDTILAGKFRNKKIVVKEIGVDLHGGPTVNGRPILQIRIPKLYNISKGITEMATKVKIKKDNGKYNLYRCTADGDEETPVNKFPYDTEEQAITTAIYKGFDVGEQAPKSRKTYLIKNEEIPRVKYDKPKEIELGIEREVKLENLIRKMIKKNINIAESKTFSDLKQYIEQADLYGWQNVLEVLRDNKYDSMSYTKSSIPTQGSPTIDLRTKLPKFNDTVTIDKVTSDKDGNIIVKTNLSYLKFWKDNIKEQFSNKKKLREIDITDPETVKKVEDYARLANEMDRLKAQLKALEKQFTPLDDEFVAMLDAVDETKERAIRTKNILITIKKKGYEAKSFRYKEGFELYFSKVNKAMKKMGEDCLAATMTMKKVSSSLAVQKMQDENKLNEAGLLSGIWNKLKNFISKFTTKIKQQGQSVDKDLNKLEQLANKQ